MCYTVGNLNPHPFSGGTVGGHLLSYADHWASDSDYFLLPDFNLYDYLYICCFWFELFLANVFMIKPTRCTNFTNLFWHETTCLRQFVCPSSGVYSLYTQQWFMSYRFVDSFRAGAYAPARKL